jgi:HEAT repeat protein
MALAQSPSYAGVSFLDSLGVSDSSQTPRDSEQPAVTSSHGIEPPQPSDAQVVHALVEVEKATKRDAPDASAALQSIPSPGPPRALGAIIYLSVGFALILLLGWTAQTGARRIRSWAATAIANGSGNTRGQNRVSGGLNNFQQSAAERLLGRMATGDSAAVDQVLAESDDWIGKAHRSSKANQFVMTTLNQHDLRARGAALQAILAMDGVARNEDGLSRLEFAAKNPTERTWALWMLGALGNRGVEQQQTVQILRGYLGDPEVRTRSEAINGLGIVATDETVPILLDRFRNDPSPVVQESAARNLGEGGMYTHEQQRLAAASLVDWVEDAQLTSPQKAWAVHALHDISGQNFGTNAEEWQRWYRESH